MRPTLTGVLAAVLLALVAAIGAESWYLWGTSDPTTSPRRPVVTGDIAAQNAVAAAAQDAAALFSTSWRRYDAHLARATDLMTPAFGERYRLGAEPLKGRVVRARSTTTTQVAAAGVMRATDDQVEALLFLDQRTTARGARPTYSARRALVTMVRIPTGWLVGNVQTR